MAINRLSDWRKRFQAQLDEAVKKVKDFASKDRMSEADKYLADLVDLDNKLQVFKEEVSTPPMRTFPDHENRMMLCLGLGTGNNFQNFSKFFKN